MKEDLIHSPIVPQCEGCLKILGEVCSAYLYPWAKWDEGRGCPLCTNVKKEEKKVEKAIDPIKISKRKLKGA